ncbi:MAG: hypothetical protein LLF95_11310 [Bacteroidales bacterium]|nr:hypothetical protein [Bacteroidales bacterium]
MLTIGVIKNTIVFAMPEVINCFRFFLPEFFTLKLNYMKSIDDAAKEAVQHRFNLAGAIKYGDIYEQGFKAGVEFAQRWIPVEEELPDPLPMKDSGCIENHELLLLQLSKYDSIEFGVRRKIDKRDYWEIPDVGNFELEECPLWRPVELK